MSSVPKTRVVGTDVSKTTDRPFETGPESQWTRDFARLRSGVPLAELTDRTDVAGDDDEIQPLHQWRPRASDER